MAAIGTLMLTTAVQTASASSMAGVMEVQQASKVSGTVTDGQDPIIGASVRVKGTSKGTITDLDGRFELDVEPGTELTVSYVGYKNVTVKASARMKIVLEEENTALNEVVVTALGIKRERKALGYALSEVKGEELTKAKETNVMNSLSGKVAGLVVQNTAGGPAGSTHVQLRGATEMTGNNQPLYVIDGVPLDNTNFGGGATADGGYDLGDGISAINPDDIENMTVLKGPAASALYGSRASHGVILITTKKAEKDRISVEYNGSLTIDTQAANWDNVQQVYGQGDHGKYITSGRNATNMSWGPKADDYSHYYEFDEIDASIALFRQDLNSLTLKKYDITSLGGDVKMWIRYANALKMRLAMRISDVAPQLAKAKFLEAIEDEGALEPIENAYVKYIHQPFSFESSNEDVDFRVNAFAEIIYGQDKTQPTGFGMTLYDYLRDEGDPRLHHYCRFLNDNFRDNTDPRIGREDFTAEVLAAEYDGDEKTKGVQMVPACWAWYDQDQRDFPWPNADCVTKSQHYREFISGREKDVVSDYFYKTVRGSVATEYVLPETPGMLVSGAEVCFLKAEAAVKGWSKEDANTLYQRGIEVAIGTVHNKVYAQTSTVSTADIATYVASHTLSTNPEKAKEQINTQAWFLHFANPLEAWANLRRSDYPALYERTQFGQGQNGYHDLENNMDQPVRLFYPQEEINYNKQNYQDVINRMGGFSWHKRMWWDTKEQNYKTYVKN